MPIKIMLNFLNSSEPIKEDAIIEHSVVVVGQLHVNNANPNGDPNNSNYPRVDKDGHGIISQECLNFRVRNAINAYYDGKYPILTLAAKEYGSLERAVLEHPDLEKSANALVKELAMGKKKSKKKGGDDDGEGGEVSLNTDSVRKARQAFMKDLAKFIDIRFFGTLITAKGDHVKMITGNKNLDVSLSESMNGIVKFTLARSLYPAVIRSDAMSKSFNGLEAIGKDRSSDTLGGTHFYVESNIYQFSFTITDYMCRKLELTYGELEILLNGIRRVFECDSASSRPSGSIHLCGLGVAMIDSSVCTDMWYISQEVEERTREFIDSKMKEGMTLPEIVRKFHLLPDGDDVSHVPFGTIAPVNTMGYTHC